MADIVKPLVGKPGWNAAVDAVIDKVNAHDANPLVTATVTTTGAAVGQLLAPTAVSGGVPTAHGYRWPDLDEAATTRTTADGTTANLLGKVTRYDTTSAAVSQALPPATAGAMLSIGWDAGTNALTLTRAGTDVIGSGSATSLVVPLAGEVLTLHCTTAGRWRVVSGFKPQASLDGRYPQVASARPGNLVVTLGDSITTAQWDNGNRVQGPSYPLWAQLFSGGRIFIARNSGVPGDTTTQMLARFTADVTAYSPTTVLITGGTNDVNTSVPLATTQANIRAIIAATRAIGAVPVLATIPPGDTQHTARAKLNHWLRRYAVAQGIALIDFYKLLVDPVTGNYLSAYNSDGTHPNVAGLRVMGQLASDVLVPLLPAWTPPLVLENTDTSGLFTTNPLHITDTNADGIPDGWIAYGNTTGTSHALVVDSAVPGKLMQVTQSAAAGARILERSIAGAGFTAGDRLSIAGVITSDGGVDAEFKADFIGASNSAKPAKFVGAVTRGVAYQEVTVPAGATSINIDLIAGAGTGVVAWGQITVLNLTTMAIV